ncbi:MAG: aldo/keto reductase [Clostridiales Family XIII bacterium]|jgi:diketogulonate reductase-like aldo/keto reductase|nr:aldo/keto reductase [Clostridiales Family XIII bacterium]
MRTISANGLILPVIGQGGWRIGEDSDNEQNEIAALRRGLELGMNLIDTAEMYGEGMSEILISKALKGIAREEYLLVSKVYPHNAGAPDIFISCDNSMRRLKTDYLDLYLLHWRGDVPLEETVECMERLVSTGKIRRWGVSNFDVADMEELTAIPGGEHCAVDQVLYNLDTRGIEFDLIPWLEKRGMGVIAYCPLAQAGTLKRMHKGILTDEVLSSVAKKYEISVIQLMLAFTLKNTRLTAIPKAGTPQHTEANAAAADIQIAVEDWDKIDEIFWPPTVKMRLDME